jgi:hypothetical protein
MFAYWFAGRANAQGAIADRTAIEKFAGLSGGAGLQLIPAGSKEYAKSLRMMPGGP